LIALPGILDYSTQFRDLRAVSYWNNVATRESILQFLNSELHSSHFDDSSLNGLQVEGTDEISKIAVSVDSGLSICESAVELGADLLIVHHGLFWGGAVPIVQVHRKVVSTLIKGNLNLFASHLPLDANEKFGNNFGLARYLGLAELEKCAEHRGSYLGAKGKNSLTFEELLAKLRMLPGGDAPISTLRFGPMNPERVAVVTGAAADELYRFEADNFDTLITGEPRQFAYHFCKERNLNAIFAGHYRTETIGVRLLGEELSKRFGVEYEFIDEPTGI